jgi:hypothetical protein
MSGKDHDNRAHPKRRNKISEQWASYPIAMLESPAYRVLSQGAHRVIARIAIELANHGGNDNGKLPVTKEQFVEYSIHAAGVAPALREAEALGFIEITEHGRGGNAEMRRPSLYRITFLNERGSKAKQPTHEWQRIKTVEEAQRIAGEARKAKSQSAVNNGHASWRKRQAKNISQYRKPVPKPVPETGTETTKSPVPETGTTGSGRKPVLLSISREGRPSLSIVSEHQGGTPYPHLPWSKPIAIDASLKGKYKCEAVFGDMALAA